MTAHTPHPDTHEYGLADGCPRCAEHAEHPFESLDAANLAVLVHRLAVGLGPRSENEARAMRALDDHRRHDERLRQVLR